MKRIIYIIFSSLCLASCSASFTNKRFVYIDKEKEWEMELVFKPDSSFILRDRYGCVQMSQKGKWSIMMNDTMDKALVVSDTTFVKVGYNLFDKIRYSYRSNADGKQYMFTEDQYFPLIRLDTMYIVDKNNIQFRKMNFYTFEGNLQRKRIRMIEEFYISKIGKSAYVNSIGEGVSVKKARLNLLKCPPYNTKGN